MGKLFPEFLCDKRNESHLAVGAFGGKLEDSAGGRVDSGESHKIKNSPYCVQCGMFGQLLGTSPKCFKAYSIVNVIRNRAMESAASINAFLRFPFLKVCAEIAAMTITAAARRSSPIISFYAPL